MCGRIAQKSAPEDYVEILWPNARLIFDDVAGPRYNIPPGTRPLTMHRLVGQAEALARLPWGYKPHGSKFFMVNAKLETIERQGWPWKLMIGAGPLLFAGLSAWRPGAEMDEANGFAIATDDALGGMVDVHDRRPVALPPELAREWVDPATPAARAKEILRAGLPETAFSWHPVRLEVGSSKYQLPDAIDPL